MLDYIYTILGSVFLDEIPDLKILEGWVMEAGYCENTMMKMTAY
jgi:hypothetical protein